jgi:hypothetical protein
MLHFLNADGDLNEDLPGPAFRLASQLGAIVKAVSARKDPRSFQTGVKCRRRPGRKPCPGEILAKIDTTNDFPIIWHCSNCDDNGLISGWQGTLFDHSYDT